MLGSGSDIDNKFSCLDYFLMMFPNKHIQKIMTLTNHHLTYKNKPLTTIGAIIKLFGLLILTTDFEFESRASL